jgi:prephenate dehydrogenase
MKEDKIFTGSRKVVIIGPGLIGGSIGKVLLEEGLAEEVVGICRRESSLRKAIAEKALSRGSVGLKKEDVKGAELIVIATPVGTISGFLEQLAGMNDIEMPPVTDVGSTKKALVQYASKEFPGLLFVGSHPLAGSEKKGVSNSTAGLFKGSVCVITPDSATDPAALGKVRSFWRGIGARTVEMTPGEHDKALAYTSHLPHAVAYSLSGVQEPEYSELVSTGFMDTTRIASSDAALWADIFISNKNEVTMAIEKFEKMLVQIKNAVKEGLDGELIDILDNCRKVRDEIVRKK